MTDNMRQALSNQEQQRRVKTENERTTKRSTASLVSSAITALATIAALIL